MEKQNKKTFSAAAEKSSIVRKLTKHFGKMWMLADNNILYIFVNSNAV